MKNALKPAMVREVRVTEKTDGKKMAVITINPKDKGVAIGKNGKNAERLRFLAKRYFDIQLEAEPTSQKKPAVLYS